MLETRICPSRGCQVLGLRDAFRTPDGSYQAEFTLENRLAVSVRFGSARTDVTTAPRASE
jgi:hypothetical protein